MIGGERASCDVAKLRLDGRWRPYNGDGARWPRPPERDQVYPACVRRALWKRDQPACVGESDDAAVWRQVVGDRVLDHLEQLMRSVGRADGQLEEQPAG